MLTPAPLPLVTQTDALKVPFLPQCSLLEKRSECSLSCYHPRCSPERLSPFQKQPSTLAWHPQLPGSCPTIQSPCGGDGSELGVNSGFTWPPQIGKLRPSHTAAAQSLNHDPRSLGLPVMSGSGWDLRLVPAGPVRKVFGLPRGPLTNTFDGVL